jgi:hypothetical protein
MSKKLDTDSFIEKAIEKHGKKYDYSLVNYINSRTKIKIICEKHGQFEITPNNFLQKKGCSKCAKSLNIKKFIEKATKKHGNKYDYSIVDIIDSKTKIKIICPTHGVFYQRPTSHYSNGCDKCAKYSTTSDFIQKAKKVHNNKYDYSNVNYINNKTPVKIICPIHGEFIQKPNIHLNGSNCQICSIEEIKIKKDFFIEKSNTLHNFKYNYSQIEINGVKNKVKIICPIHGEFYQTPENHLLGKGCSSCNESTGEKKVSIFLDNNNIKYEKQKTFKNCTFKRKLKFDFYLPDYNTCIEYDGIQHYESIEIFGGKDSLIKQIEKDNIKNKYCKNNNITLLRIKYSDSVEDKLKTFTIK